MNDVNITMLVKTKDGLDSFSFVLTLPMSVAQDKLKKAAADTVMEMLYRGGVVLNDGDELIVYPTHQITNVRITFPHIVRPS